MTDELPTFENIIVPLDGSQLAETALPVASAIATAADSRIDLVTVALTYDAPLDTQMDSATRNALHRAEAAVIARHPKVKQTVLAGIAADEIVAHARKSNADLIVMATHGRTGLRRFVLGSVAEKLLSICSVPVLLVRSQGTSTGFAPLKPAEFLRVVVPLDGSSSTPASMPYALSLARLLNTKALVVYADEGNDPESAEGQLRAFAAVFADAGAEPEIRIQAGKPGEVISSAVEPGDLIVMASLSATGVARGSHRGSVADYVVKHAEAPVLVVPPTGYLGAALE